MPHPSLYVVVPPGDVEGDYWPTRDLKPLWNSQPIFFSCFPIPFKNNQVFIFPRIILERRMNSWKSDLLSSTKFHYIE